MPTISRLFVATGFCPVGKKDVAIEVEYTSLPLPNKDKHQKLFIKSGCKCCYLSDGRCNHKSDCPIYKNAPTKRHEDFSKTCY